MLVCQTLRPSICYLRFIEWSHKVFIHRLKTFKNCVKHNKQHSMKEPLKSFHLNDHTKVFHPKLELTPKTMNGYKLSSCHRLSQGIPLPLPTGPISASLATTLYMRPFSNFSLGRSLGLIWICPLCPFSPTSWIHTGALGSATSPSLICTRMKPNNLKLSVECRKTNQSNHFGQSQRTQTI